MNLRKMLGVLMLAAAPMALEAAPAAAKPNVLYVVVDDLNDYISVLANYPGVKTPNLDKFARSATRFTHGYCAAPICNPSRAAMLSGIAPYRTGVYENDDPIIRSRPVVNAVLLPEQFHRSGYFTMWNGKIFHSMLDKPRMAAMWDDPEGGQGQYGPRPTRNPIPDSIRKPPMFSYEAWTGPDTDFCDFTHMQINASRLSRHYDKPFFLAYGIYRPHNPWTAPKRYFDLHPLESIKLPDVPADDLADLPPLGVEYAHYGPSLQQLKAADQWRRIVQAYLASISFMDDCLGQVLDALDRSPYRDNTIVCLVADNGFHLGEKEHFAKYALWEQTTHVLYLWRVPGMTTPGSTCDVPVSLLDVYPTLNELCGLSAPPQHLDGTSIVRLLKDPKAAWDRTAVTTYRQNDHAVRDRRWRYIRYHDGTEELYDDEKDPREWTNLAAKPEFAAVKQRLAQSLPTENQPRVGKSKAAGDADGG